MLAGFALASITISTRETISRTLIASNSNTDKTFGIELEIIKDNTSIEVKELTFNKKSSNAISDLKPGWNYTKAGFWFEELDDISDVSIKIRLLILPFCHAGNSLCSIIARGSIPIKEGLSKIKFFKTFR